MVSEIFSSTSAEWGKARNTHVIIILKKDVGLVAIDHIYRWEYPDRLVMVGELLVTRPWKFGHRCTKWRYQVNNVGLGIRTSWHLCCGRSLIHTVNWITILATWTHFEFWGAASIAPIQFACICDRDTDICMTNTSSWPYCTYVLYCTHKTLQITFSHLSGKTCDKSETDYPWEALVDGN